MGLGVGRGGEALPSALASKVEVEGGQCGTKALCQRLPRRRCLPGETHAGTCMCTGPKSCARDSGHRRSYFVCEERTPVLSYWAAMITCSIVLREAEGKQAEPEHWELSFPRILGFVNLAGNRD